MWAAPALVLATATPAAAAGSLENGELKFTHMVAWVDGSPTPTGLAGTTGVQTQYSDTAQNVTTLTVTFQVAKQGMAVAPAQVVSGAGWTPAGATSDDTSVYYTVAWAGTMDPSLTQVTSELRFVLPGSGLDSSAFPKAAQATVASPQASGETRSGTIVATATPENPIVFV